MSRYTVITSSLALVVAFAATAVGCTAESSPEQADTNDLAAAASCSASEWQAGKDYRTGDVVTYKGATYIAEHENPGYDPTVSTWFWEPHAACSDQGGGTGNGGQDNGCSASAWQAGKDYRTGDIVNYNGSTYIAEHDNPGYDPAVSTWFWDPHSACGGTTGGGTTGGGTTGGTGSGERFSGFASYNFYDGVPATSTKCVLDAASFQYQVTALRTDIQNRLNACGKCARVTSKNEGGGNGSTVVVHIIDNSNDYSSNGGNRLLDIAPQAFDKIGDRDRGSIPVDFEIIDCQ